MPIGRIALVFCITAALTTALIEASPVSPGALYGEAVNVSEKPDIPNVSITTRSVPPRSDTASRTVLQISNTGSTPLYLDIDTAFWDSPANYTAVHQTSGLPRPLIARYKIVNSTAFYYDQTREYATPPKPAPTPAGKYVHAWKQISEKREQTPGGAVLISATEFALPELPGNVGDEGVVAVEIGNLTRPYRYTYSLWYNGTQHTVAGTVDYAQTEDRQLEPPSDPVPQQQSWLENILQELGELLAAIGL